MPTMLHTWGPRKPSSRGDGSIPSSIGCSARFFLAITLDPTLEFWSTPGQAEVQGRSYGVVRLVPARALVNGSLSRRSPPLAPSQRARSGEAGSSPGRADVLVR